VRNRHQLAGRRFPGVPSRQVIDRFSFYVSKGRWAIGFGMVGGRMSELIAGTRQTFVRELRVYGPL